MHYPSRSGFAIPFAMFCALKATDWFIQNVSEGVANPIALIKCPLSYHPSLALLRCVVAPLRETLFCLSHNFDSDGLVYNGENSHLGMGLLKLQLPEERPSRSL